MFYRHCLIEWWSWQKSGKLLSHNYLMASYQQNKKLTSNIRLVTIVGHLSISIMARWWSALKQHRISNECLWLWPVISSRSIACSPQFSPRRPNQPSSGSQYWVQYSQILHSIPVLGTISKACLSLVSVPTNHPAPGYGSPSQNVLGTKLGSHYWVQYSQAEVHKVQ